VAAFEIMVCTPAIRSAIREAKTPQIYSAIQTGSRLGMIQMDQYLKNLYTQGIVDYEEALAHCNNPDDFEKRVGR
jgi:twitching motility protein PilT